MTLSKRERHLVDLRNYTRVNNEIESYLLEHSNLPGKRGNIELAFAFADYMEDQYNKNKEQALTYCLTHISEYPHDIPKAQVT